jgi:hypothetical protein
MSSSRKSLLDSDEELLVVVLVEVVAAVDVLMADTVMANSGRDPTAACRPVRTVLRLSLVAVD